MRIAVVGATGNIGSLVVPTLEQSGHEVVRISRSLGIDVRTGDGLDEALAGVDGVVDVTNAHAPDLAQTVVAFGTATRNLLAAEQRAGVRHHVLLSIAGVERITGDAHYSGKQEQERLVEGGSVPWTIVPATQFHDFAATAVSWTEKDGVAPIAPLLVQPIAPRDVAAVLSELVVGVPQGRYVDVAGPDTQDLVDMARRTNEARGRTVKLVPTWSGPFGPEWAGDVLLPREGARIERTSFEDWLLELG